jgi:hypothetical protein
MYLYRILYNYNAGIEEWKTFYYKMFQMKTFNYQLENEEENCSLCSKDQQKWVRFTIIALMISKSESDLHSFLWWSAKVSQIYAHCPEDQQSESDFLVLALMISKVSHSASSLPWWSAKWVRFHNCCSDDQQSQSDFIIVALMISKVSQIS